MKTFNCPAFSLVFPPECLLRAAKRFGEHDVELMICYWLLGWKPSRLAGLSALCRMGNHCFSQELINCFVVLINSCFFLHILHTIGLCAQQMSAVLLILKLPSFIPPSVWYCQFRCILYFNNKPSKVSLEVARACELDRPPVMPLSTLAASCVLITKVSLEVARAGNSL